MTVSSILLPFLVGLAVGLICVGGLAGGIKIAMAASASTSKWRRWSRIGLSFVILVGQLVVALVILTQTRFVQDSPLFLGLGLISAILISSLILNKILKINRK